MDKSSPTGEWRAIVRWHEDYLEWYLDNDQLLGYVATPNDKHVNIPSQVIGNIYENPRLAKKL